MKKQELDLNEIKAREILDYCFTYLGQTDDLSNEGFSKTKIYKEMLKEIKFLLENS